MGRSRILTTWPSRLPRTPRCPWRRSLKAHQAPQARSSSHPRTPSSSTPSTISLNSTPLHSTPDCLLLEPEAWAPCSAIDEDTDEAPTASFVLGSVCVSRKRVYLAFVFIASTLKDVDPLPHPLKGL